MFEYLKKKKIHSTEYYMVIVKHKTPHFHEFMWKYVIFHVNQINYDQEQCTVALIQREWRRKNRLGAEMIAGLLRMLCDASGYSLNALTC